MKMMLVWFGTGLWRMHKKWFERRAASWQSLVVVVLWHQDVSGVGQIRVGPIGRPHSHPRHGSMYKERFDRIRKEDSPFSGSRPKDGRSQGQKRSLPLGSPRKEEEEESIPLLGG